MASWVVNQIVDGKEEENSEKSDGRFGWWTQ